MSEQVLNLEVVAEESGKLQIKGDLKAQLETQLVHIGGRVPLYEREAASLIVKTAADAARADELLAKISADEKAIEDKAGMLSKIKTAAFGFHRLITSFEGQFSKPLAAAKLVAKRKRDEWTAAEAAKAAAEQRRLQAIEDERVRKLREIEDQKAAAARALEAQKEREAAEARRAAGAAEGAERARLQREADAADRAAAAARAKAEVREEKSASVQAAVVTVAAPESRKGASLRWVVKSFDMTNMGIPEAVQGYLEVKTANLARAKAANPMLKIAGVEFHQVTV